MKPRKDSTDKGAGSGCMARLVRFFSSICREVGYAQGDQFMTTVVASMPNGKIHHTIAICRISANGRSRELRKLEDSSLLERELLPEGSRLRYGACASAGRAPSRLALVCADSAVNSDLQATSRTDSNDDMQCQGHPDDWLQRWLFRLTRDTTKNTKYPASPAQPAHQGALVPESALKQRGQ